MQLEDFLTVTATLTPMYWNNIISCKSSSQELKALLEDKLGQGALKDREIILHENDEHTLHISIPKKPRASNDQVLAEEELDKVAGGGSITFVDGGHVGSADW